MPASKPALAVALAAEWEALRNAKDASRTHLLPLTGLIGRATEIETEDREHHTTAVAGHEAQSARAEGEGVPPPHTAGPVRNAITRSALRHFATDALLCFAPSPTESTVPREDTLRARQERAAGAVTAPLLAPGAPWAGVRLRGALADDGAIGVRAQEPETRAVVAAWLRGLHAWELAGVEAAVGAGRSVCVAARLLLEWGAGGHAAEEVQPARGGRGGEGELGEGRFGVEEAARAVTLEVDWQTGVWGEVEDSHDVDREDVRRLLGSAVLLMAGEERM